LAQMALLLISITESLTLLTMKQTKQKTTAILVIAAIWISVFALLYLLYLKINFFIK